MTDFQQDLSGDLPLPPGIRGLCRAAAPLDKASLRTPPFTAYLRDPLSDAPLPCVQYATMFLLKLKQIL